MPWDYDYSQDSYDGLFLSNGPGDPAVSQDAVDILQKVNSTNLLYDLYMFVRAWLC